MRETFEYGRTIPPCPNCDVVTYIDSGTNETKILKNKYGAIS